MAEVPKPTQGKRISSSGTVITSGIISLEEYNRKLTGKTGLEIYDKMRRSDGSTSSALRIVKLPLLSATWKVAPASDDEQDKKAAEVCQHNLDFIGWKQILKEILLHLDFGYSVFEKVYDVIPSEFGDYLGITELGSIKQKTVLRWEQQNGSPGITQTNSSGPEVSVPLEKLMIFTNDMEGQNYEGKPLLRPAYKHWYMKESLYKVDALSHEKQGLGIPYLETPAGASPTDKEKAREIAKNIRANEAVFAEMPADFKLSFMDMMARTLRDPVASIDHHTTQIMKSVLAQFLELSGSSSSGSNALSRDQSGLFMKSEEAAADYVTERINKYFIPDIMAMNFPNAKAMPKLTYSDLDDTDTVALAKSVSELLNAGALTPEAEMEKHLRGLYDLPALPQAIAEDYDNRVLPKTNLPSGSSPGDTQASFNQAIRSLDNFIEASLKHDSRTRHTAKG